MSATVVTDATFQKEILDTKGVTLVDFWATWCQPCKIVGPIIDELAGEYGEKVKVAKVDVDENPNFAGQYGVMSIPTIVIFKDGKPAKTLIGVQAKDTYKKTIEEVLAS